ncbi:Cell division protein ZipA [hydrothermal vent metagenome]|uniref:Cell division protein ZipA n=1 Tax=hydrothermal vent metagenome TaxID=652676 RepID=A0A3B0VWB5_9ZZZZ
MNELQQVLLIFAVVVIAALYFLSRSRQSALKKEQPNQKQGGENRAEKATPKNIDDSYQKASHALNELDESHIPVSKNTEAHIVKEENREKTEENRAELEVSEQQGVLPFGEEFGAVEKESRQKNIESHELSDHVFSDNASQSDSTPASVEQVSSVHEEQMPEEQVIVENDQGGKHHVLVVEKISFSGEGDPYEKPSFGIPEEFEQSEKDAPVFKKEPQTFVILVMSTGQEFSMFEVNQALLGVGLTFIDSQIYVKQDNMGGDIIKVANLMEPGTFSVDDLKNNSINNTCGVALILELPTTVKAPAAMHDLIMMARKISQRLQGRLYNMDRQLLKESDLQKMRDVAIKYESEPLG